ncbi:hypothetical protein SAMN05216596_103573 [Pseudomonas congelans]|uniref:Uncharacterized protein n=1 Tax=Pseudomonas congelans TaxID=200452 RepID=A0A1H0RR28_9PSED|nr:hypothetical protein [Pseudomonas sp. PvP027]SDP31917.1 hypothetical protein SAMN05216596_103573 [Pseudomonas congelans]
MYLTFLFRRGASACWQGTYTGADKATLPVDRFVLQMRSASSDGLK